ncbi:predicted protein [Nematostella vectensis]|uniref:K Homology domain-containing protein n=1 Tax=Nematostella vectensis TaxID=45351 RepID=A7T2D7_NEMVE|nr:predicted protein [Nematostella vectensis]|eukprot:XP_001621981.1 hypothetical protein NEMVEDRAFT_v1g142990 [Nematostella vectensis]
MDVLRPSVVWVDGRCYRKLPCEQMMDSGTNKELDLTYEDEVCDALNLVESTANGFKSSMGISCEVHRFIIGYKGNTKRQIEQDTNTRISIPRVGQTGDIVITGQSKAEVLSARHKVDIVVESSRHKVPFTHFLSFPLYFDQLEKKAKEFKQIVLQEYSEDRGIDASIFQEPSKLHLTIGMMVLLGPCEVEKAGKSLSECYQDLVRECVGDDPLMVELKGVEYMNDDPTNVDVLYIKVQETDGGNRLQKLANALMEAFVSCGLMRQEYDKVKLHATIMNSKQRATSEPPDSKRRKPHGPQQKRVSFDARNIVTHFKDFSFGEYQVDRIHVSQRGVFDSKGHYHCSAEVLIK